jgi:hypothetical protein
MKIMGGRSMGHFINWEQFNDEVVESTHGKIKFYRDLYDGNHAELFPRAKDLKEKGEIVEIMEHGKTNARKYQPPYIVANVSKLVVDIPAMLISRAIGQPTIKEDTRMPVETEETAGTPRTGDEGTLIENEPEEDDTLGDIVEGIYNRSRLQFEHWTNITQHQVDGGIVGVVIDDDAGIRIQTKARDMYYPHPDGLGCDLVYDNKRLYVGTDDNGEDEYDDFVHIHREWIEKGDCHTQELLYRKGSSDKIEPIEDEAEVARLLGMDANMIKQVFADRDRTFVVYWANDKTFRDELGQSALKNQESKQDEINWTLTRGAIVFQRNGKPRIKVTEDTFDELQRKAFERYNDENLIDADDLEITTYDEKGNSLEVVQIDVSKIGNIQWVKDLMKLMFIETRTSEKAVDFYLDGSSSGAQSGVAKFYDLFVSIMKADKIAAEYVEFLEELFENALYFAKKYNPEIEITRPNFTMREMIPVTRKERVETESMAFSGEIQSREQSVKRMNPDWTDEEVEAELEKIEESKQTTNSTNLANGAASTNLQNLLDNRDSNGNPISATEETGDEDEIDEEE